MDNIPIFCGGPIGQESWQTCGQFLSLIEEYVAVAKLSEEQTKELCHSKLSEKALDLFQDNYDMSWIELKELMLKNFSVKLSIREKVEVRKNLQQFQIENIDDFYERCVQAQFLGMILFELSLIIFFITITFLIILKILVHN